MRDIANPEVIVKIETLLTVPFETSYCMRLNP